MSMALGLVRVDAGIHEECGGVHVVRQIRLAAAARFPVLGYCITMRVPAKEVHRSLT